MKTYKIEQYDLVHLLHYNMEIQEYIRNIVCPKLNLDLTKGKANYDLVQGTITYEDNQQPQPENKPGESGNK